MYLLGFFPFVQSFLRFHNDLCPGWLHFLSNNSFFNLNLLMYPATVGLNPHWTWQDSGPKSLWCLWKQCPSLCISVIKLHLLNPQILVKRLQLLLKWMCRETKLVLLDQFWCNISGCRSKHQSISPSATALAALSWTSHGTRRWACFRPTHPEHKWDTLALLGCCYQEV